MTRRSKREIERALENLSSTDGETFDVVFRRDWTDGYVDRDRELIEPNPDADTVVVINQRVVMMRERAEAEGYEILGPAENTPPENDAVRVAWEEA